MSSLNLLCKLMKAGERVLLVGRPGCAKTARISAAAKLCGRRLIVMRASLCERVDFAGVMVPDMKAGLARALPLDLLHELQTTKVPVLLFIDDLGQAPVDVQAALMRVFDEMQLSEQVLIWGATNRPGDKAGVTALCEPLRSRFGLAFRIAGPDDDLSDMNGGVPLCTWAEEIEGWCEWAMDHDAPAEIIAWHRATQGRTLYAWKPHADPSVRMPDYRTWETVVRRWNDGMRDLNILGAAIGRPVAAELIAFAKLADQLPTPDQVKMDPKGAMLPVEPQALFLVCSFLSVAADAASARAFVLYLQRLPRVYGALLARDMNRKLGAKLTGTKEWVDFFTKNQALFNVGGN